MVVISVSLPAKGLAAFDAIACYEMACSRREVGLLASKPGKPIKGYASGKFLIEPPRSRRQAGKMKPGPCDEIEPSSAPISSDTKASRESRAQRPNLTMRVANLIGETVTGDFFNRLAKR